MSIQVITDFQAETQICICRDENHIEVFSEGKGGDLLQTLAKATAQILLDLGKKYAKSCEESGEEIKLKMQKGELSEQDKGELAIISKFKEMFDYEIATCKIEQTAEKLGVDMPDFMKNLILKGLKDKLEETLGEALGGDDEDE